MTDAPPEGPEIGRLHRRPLAQEAARQENRKEGADQSLRDGKTLPGQGDTRGPGPLVRNERGRQTVARRREDRHQARRVRRPSRRRDLPREYIVDRWWPSRTDEPSTAGPMHSRIWNHIIPILGDLAHRDIDASALRSFKAALLTRVEDTTAEVIWGHLSSILNSTVDDQRLLRNPSRSTEASSRHAFGEEGQSLGASHRRRGPLPPSRALQVRGRPRARTRPAPGRSLRPGRRRLRLRSWRRTHPAPAQVGHQGTAVLLPPKGRQDAHGTATS